MVTSIIRECVKIIDNHEESDCEAYRVSYSLSYKDGQIRFTRSTTSPTGETYSDGGIDTKTNGYVLEQWEATIQDYCNLAIMFANSEREHLKYEYGENVEAINFEPISPNKEWKPFPMRKEFKLDAYEGVLALKQAHFHLSNLYNFAIQQGVATGDDIRAFDKTYNKLSSSSIEYNLKDNLFEDDDYYKERDL